MKDQFKLLGLSNCAMEYPSIEARVNQVLGRRSKPICDDIRNNKPKSHSVKLKAKAKGQPTIKIH